MSADKHTPGPWTAEMWTDDAAGIYGWSFVAHGCRLPLGDREGDPDEANANARLIAAAPELLQELKHAAELLVSLSTECRTACLDGERVDTLAAAERFDSLIAKATGSAS